MPAHPAGDSVIYVPFLERAPSLMWYCHTQPRPRSCLEALLTQENSHGLRGNTCALSSVLWDDSSASGPSSLENQLRSIATCSVGFSWTSIILLHQISENAVRVLILALRNALKACGFVPLYSDVLLEGGLFLFSFYFCDKAKTRCLKKSKTKAKQNQNAPPGILPLPPNIWWWHVRILIAQTCLHYKVPTCSRQYRE